jgi:hypothetical protein
MSCYRDKRVSAKERRAWSTYTTRLPGATDWATSWVGLVRDVRVKGGVIAPGDVSLAGSAPALRVVGHHAAKISTGLGTSARPWLLHAM